MKSFLAQSSLNAGVLSPKMNARYDLAQYYKGLSKADNVLSQPQGGMLKRYGTQFIERLDAGTITDWTAKLIAFDPYILFFYSNGATTIRCFVYMADTMTKQTNINGSGNDYFDVPISSDQVFKFAVSTDGIVMVDGNNPPVLITTTGATSWAATPITFANVPQFDFNDASSPAPTSAVWEVTLPGNVSGDTIRASIDGIQSEAFPVSSVATETAANIQLAYQQILSNFTAGDVTCVLKAGTTYTVTFANTAADNYDSVNLVPELTSAAPVGTNPVNTVVGVPRKEPVWSATRGYPRTVTFHENRLVFGGTDSRPQTVWMSRTGEFFDFKNYRNLDNESIDVTLETSANSPIVNLYSDRHLCVFTEKGEHYCPPIPVTPVNVAFPQQSEFGSRYGCNVVSIDNQVIFGQNTITGGYQLSAISGFGGSVRNFVFRNDQKAYTAESLSVVADSVVDAPRQFATLVNSDESDAAYLFAVMGNGQLSILNTIGSEGVLSWTTFGVDKIALESGVEYALYKDVVTLNGEVFFLMKRGGSGTILQADDFFLERIPSMENVNTRHYLDAWQEGSQASSTTVNVGADFNGLEVSVINEVSGAVYEGLTVSAGAVTTPEAVTDYTVGLPFAPVLRTMPLNVTLQDGPHAGEPKRIVSVSSALLNSKNVLVNDEDLIFPVDDSDPVSGRFDVRLSGWSVEAYVTITQDGPYPMNILDLIVEIDV